MFLPQLWASAKTSLLFLIDELKCFLLQDWFLLHWQDFACQTFPIRLPLRHVTKTFLCQTDASFAMTLAHKVLATEGDPSFCLRIASATRKIVSTSTPTLCCRNRPTLYTSMRYPCLGHQRISRPSISKWQVSHVSLQKCGNSFI